VGKEESRLVMIPFAQLCIPRFGDTTSGVIQEAAKGAHGPVVLKGSAEERVALPRGEAETPAKDIVEISRVMHSATEYKCSVAIARYEELRRRSAS
jgi:hypothetical protein